MAFSKPPVRAREKGAPKMLLLLVAALFVSSILPASLGVAIELGAILAGYIWWLSQPKASRRGSLAILVSMAILCLWATLVLHPNVPSLEVGVHGLRKTALCVAGLALGAAVPSSRRIKVEFAVIRILIAALVVSIFLHLVTPGLEQAISRGAGVYTGLYAGRPRLQGIFSGPFHVALAATMLVGWAVVRGRSAPTTARIAIVVAVFALYLAMVRSGFVAVVLVILVASIVAMPVHRAIRRAMVASVGMLAVVGAWFFIDENSAGRLLGSIANLDEDSRYMNRFPGYERGLQSFIESPIIGWGAGSAGDTLGPEFVQGFHVTSHNIILKFAVEGGIIGLFLWILFIAVILLGTLKGSVERRMVAVLVTTLFSIGMTVASTEALPVSLLIFMLIGLQLNRRTFAKKSGNVSGIHSRQSTVTT